MISEYNNPYISFMLYSVFGKLILKKPKLAVVEVNGLGLEFLISPKTSRKLPKIGSRVKIFCTPCVNKEGVELYGFLTNEEKELFDTVNSAPGIGPKSTLGLLERFPQDKLFSIINNNRADLLAQVSGMGQKRSERLILELKNKIKKTGNEGAALVEENLELAEVLKALGYKQKEINEALKRLSDEPMKLEERIKQCLTLLKK